MTTPLQAYGASLAVLALEAAKAAGHEMLTALEAGAAAKVPVITTVAVTTFFDHVPTSYRTEVQALLTPEMLAAQQAIDAGLTDRIHIGVAIAQASLDTRITALQTTVRQGPPTVIPSTVKTS